MFSSWHINNNWWRHWYLCCFAENGNRPFHSSLVPLFQSESKCETILMKMTLICMKKKLRAELIFIWKVSRLDSLWNRGTRELGNGLLKKCTKNYDARAQPLFSSLNLLFSDVAVAVVANSLIGSFSKPRRWQRREHLQAKSFMRKKIAKHVLNLCSFLCRPLHYNNLKWLSSMYFGEGKPPAMAYFWYLFWNSLLSWLHV